MTKESDAQIYYTSIVNTVRESLIILDAELKVVTANNAFYTLFCVSKEETEGKYIYELGSRQWDLNGLKEILEKIIPLNDQFQDYVAEYTFPVIGHKIMLLNGRRINQGEGYPQRILLAIEDATERLMGKRSLEKYAAMLEDANAQLRSFDFTVSHDLRAPLNIISGYTSLLLEEHAGQLDGGGKHLLSVLHNKVQEMDALIRDLLRFSRVSLKEIQVAPIDMNRLAASAAAEVRDSFPRRNIEVTIHPLPSTRGDAAMIRQVWVNLIDNAAKFTRHRETAVIEIGGRVGDKEHEYYVRDNGVGFDMKFADNLFGIFQRLHTAKDYEGTGTGLAIVSRTVQRHGGRVWAESKVDGGATFSFALPAE